MVLLSSRKKQPITDLKENTVVEIVKLTGESYHDQGLSIGRIVHIMPVDDKLFRLETLNNNIPKTFVKYIDVYTKMLIVKPIAPTAAKEFTEQLYEAYKKTPFAVIESKGVGLSTGTDPECFVTKANGEVIPAWKFLQDKKDNSEIFYDGFQAELTTPPCSCHDSLLMYIQQNLAGIHRAALKHDPNALLTSKDVIDIPYEVMKACTPEQTELGCSPSLNIYPDILPIAVEDPSALPIRFAGVHYHAGLQWLKQKQDKERMIERTVKTLDRILGPIMTSVLRTLEDPRRRQFYGRPGEYRLPPHGLEYRTGSSTILCHPTVTYLFFDLARAITYLGARGKSSFWDCDEQEAREVIVNCDHKGAEKILRCNKELLGALLERIYCNKIYKDAALELIWKGAKELLPLDNMGNNWFLPSPKGMTEVLQHQVRALAEKLQEKREKETSSKEVAQGFQATGI